MPGIIDNLEIKYFASCLGGDSELAGSLIYFFLFCGMIITRKEVISMGKIWRDVKTISKFIIEHQEEIDADKHYMDKHRPELRALIEQREIERKQAKKRKFEQEEERRKNSPDYYKMAIGRFDLIDD